MRLTLPALALLVLPACSDPVDPPFMSGTLETETAASSSSGGSGTGGSTGGTSSTTSGLPTTTDGTNPTGDASSGTSTSTDSSSSGASLGVIARAGPGGRDARLTAYCFGPLMVEPFTLRFYGSSQAFTALPETNARSKRW